MSNIDIYVFVSRDRSAFGLTTDPVGANLPRWSAPWAPYEVIPMATSYIGKYARNADAVIADLLRSGFHIELARGVIVPFPGGRPRK